MSRRDQAASPTKPVSEQENECEVWGNLPTTRKLFCFTYFSASSAPPPQQRLALTNCPSGIGSSPLLGQSTPLLTGFVGKPVPGTSLILPSSIHPSLQGLNGSSTSPLAPTGHGRGSRPPCYWVTSASHLSDDLNTAPPSPPYM